MKISEKTMLEFAGFCFIHKPELASEINTLIANFINKPNEALILPVINKSFCDYCSEELKEEETVWVCQDCRDGMV